MQEKSPRINMLNKVIGYKYTIPKLHLHILAMDNQIEIKIQYSTQQQQKYEIGTNLPKNECDLCN